jgi:hypothetical protein
MITSDTTTEIALALVNFHKAVGKIKKDATNPFLKSKYAELPAILEAINEPLNSSGLTVVHFPEVGNLLTTRLLHISGEWMQASFEMKGTETPQAQGSAITYARRYVTSALLNLTIDEDDDGNAASGKTMPAKRPAGTPTNKPLISKSQWEKATARIEKGERDIIKKIQDAYELTQDQLNALLIKRNSV